MTEVEKMGDLCFIVSLINKLGHHIPPFCSEVLSRGWDEVWKQRYQ